MNMKKIISWGMMLAAAFTLTNCAKEIEDPNQQPEKQGYPFEIVASTVDTKTVNDGMATNWDDNDAINLFHAVAGAQDYGTNDEFTIADVETGRFTGMLTEALEAGESYDWYALYPYNSNIATPGDRADGYTFIGHSKGLNQTGYDNMASLKETICPLYGVAKAVASSDTPSITMNHLTSVVAIKVTNTTEEPLTITTASLTAEEDIVGSYFIDITKSPVVYKASEGYVTNTAVVNVSNGTDLAKGESATLYLAIKPFTAKAGTSLTLSVNDYAKDPKVLTSDVTFHAGKIKTLNFAYDKVAPKTVTWDLSKNTPSEATEDKIAWTSDSAEMYCEKAGSTTNANNYYGEDVNKRTSTRFYKNSILTIAPKTGYKITSVVFTATSDGYATALSSSTWANASAEASSTTVTVTPTDGTQPMTATIGGTCGFTSVVVYYTENEGGETPAPETLVSIAVENPKIHYTVGETFVAPTVKATYSRETVKAVTGATFTGYDMTTAGEQTVTVSYTEGDVTATTTYDITVSPAEILVEDGTYVIAVKEEGVYYAASIEANGTRRAYVELSYSSGEYVSHDSKIVWTIANSGAGIIVSSGEQYWGAVKNGISLVETASVVSVAKSETEGAFYLSADCGSDGVRYLAKNGTYGFGFYAEAEDVYLIPAIFVELPTLETPVVDAVLNATGTGIDVSWTAVDNATSYVVSCTNQADQTVISGTQCSFTDLPAGTYNITVTAKAENYNSATSEPVSIIIPSAAGEKSWTLVTDASTLAAGDKIIIAAKDYDYAISETQNKNNRGQASITKSGNTVTLGTGVQELTLEAGNKSGTFSFNTGSGYLYAASSSSNYLRTETSLSDNSSWKITIAADGTATVVAQGTNTRNTMQYNPSSSLFACYSSASQKAIVIYKYQ